MVKGQLKELVRGSVEETRDELLEAEAEKLTQAAQYEQNEQRRGSGLFPMRCIGMGKKRNTGSEGGDHMRIPRHIGVIPDGNRRWAERAGLPKKDGYAHGLAPGSELLRLARDAGIQEITYYGFTTDNCKRPPEQVEAFSQACVEAIGLIASEPVSLLVIGDEEAPTFPSALAPYTTRRDLNGGGIRVNFLVDYGWEWDLACLERSGGSRKKICDGLRSHDVSRVDLVIRWGGMRRLSGFLPVQSVYADIFVVDRLWPDFQPEDFYQALEWYQKQDVTLGG